MTRAIFILSFDCEGKWGLADRPDALASLSSNALLAAYRRLADLLRQHDIPATFAFVASLLLTPDDVRARRDWFERIPYRGGDWAANFRTALAAGKLDGWLCPNALETVAAEGRHEIAAHGFSHVPLAEHAIDATVFEQELDRLRAVEQQLGISTRTFVYPRNLVGFTERLAAWGFVAYRPPLKFEAEHSRARRLLAEFSLFEPPQGHGRGGIPMCLPPGRFLNYRVGLRRLVPRAVTLAKVRHMLDVAVQRGQTVHLYAHPHNFVTGSHQFELLASILDEVRKRIDAGHVSAMTQYRYYEMFAASPVSAAGDDLQRRR